MRFSVIGMPKTGTTALYNLIKHNLPKGNNFYLFEPALERELKGALKFNVDNLLIKFMVHKLEKVSFKLSMFDKNILIVRDPRDFIISSLLYRFNNQDLIYDKKKFERAYELFVQKENDPESISCVDLLKFFNISAPENFRKKTFDMFFNLIDLDKKNEIFTYKYEDMIDGDYASLSSYLNIEFNNIPDPEGWTSKIARSKSYGDWKNWFTNKDIAFFGQSTSDFIEHFGYDQGWKLNDLQVVNPQTCSNYILSLSGKVKSDPLYSKSELSEEYVNGLRSAVNDGKNVAMLKLALLMVEGNEFVAKDEGEAIKLLDRASRLGNHKATNTLGAMYLVRGGAEDIVLARSVFRRGAIDGNKESIVKIIEVVGMQNDTAAEEKWKRKLGGLD